jgi:Tfp pilus assembly protein PilO
MKIGIEDFLYNIDQNFAKKSQKDRYLVYFMAFAGIFALSYLLFWESSEKEFQSIRQQVTAREAQLKVDESYLKNNPEAKISQIENETIQIKKSYAEYQDYNSYIKFQIKQISSLFYDEKTWGSYIHSIAKNAKKYGVKLINFGNEFTTDTRAFGHVLDISVLSVGNYESTLKFINSLEQSFLIVDLHDFNISASEQLSSDLNISVWGLIE